MAVNLRNRALEMKEHDDDLRKRELEVGRGDALNADADRSELQQPGQQQQAPNESVSQADPGLVAGGREQEGADHHRHRDGA
jgi:hypothetical protein